MRHTAAYGLCNIHKVLVAAISFTQPKRQRKTPHKLIRMNNAKCDSSYSLVNAPSNIYQRTRATIYCLICLLFLIFWTTHSFIHKHLHRRFSPHIFHFMTFLVPLAFCFGFQQQSKKKPRKKVYLTHICSVGFCLSRVLLDLLPSNGMSLDCSHRENQAQAFGNCFVQSYNQMNT